MPETPRQQRKRIIGGHIRELREASGLTKGEILRELHISRTQLLKWETGVWEPNAEHLSGLAHLFGVPVHTFYVEAAA